MAISGKTFLAIPNGTRILNYGYDQCVALFNHYHINVLRGSFVPVQSAYQLWTGSYHQINTIYRKSSKPVAGAVFIARGGIYDRTHGHVGIVTKVRSNGTFDTMEQNAGTWRYVGRYVRNTSGILGFLVPKNNPIVTAAKMSANQRKVGKNTVKRRTSATTKSKEKSPSLSPNAIATLSGWKRGEKVNDGNKNTNVWYRGHSGDWFWAGGFTSQSTTGLKDLNPPPAVNKRKVDPKPVNVRKSASTKAKVVGKLAANSTVTPTGYVIGEKVSGINIWYKVAKGYAWAGGFVIENTSGLKKL